MESHSILVVDDDRQICELLEKALKRAGHTVCTAANGREASLALSRGRFDVIVTDLIMPEKDGMQLLIELRKSHPDVPVLAMTGGGHIPQAEYLKIARAFGASAVLLKPFTYDEFLASLNTLLPKKSPDS